ncbi:MAG: FkbM family methyltransferase [Actinomycetota bacterium]|nr:FkbM family methyltransferase [Actinomycetota bacterium]
MIRTLPPELGGAKYAASVEGGLKYLRPNAAGIDPLLVGVAKRYVRPGNTVWDVGANLGLFSWIAAGLAGSQGSVLAVEPDPWLASQLQRARFANQLRDIAPVEIIVGAAGASWTASRLCIAQSGRAANYLEGFGSTVTDGLRHSYMAIVFPVDHLLEHFRPPDLVKIDVEGSEAEVLEGAQKTLATYRPICLIEIRPSFADFGDWLRDCGYDLFDASTSDFAQGRLTPIRTVAYNTLAIPHDVSTK